MVSIAPDGDRRAVRWTAQPKFEPGPKSVALDPQSLPVMRALAQQLNAHPSWVMLVGVRPQGADPAAQQVALTKAFTLVQVLRSLTHRDAVAEPVGWTAVQGAPGARAAGIGILIVDAPAKTSKGAGRSQRKAKKRRGRKSQRRRPSKPAVRP